jgi:hypothetical protein
VRFQLAVFLATSEYTRAETHLVFECVLATTNDECSSRTQVWNLSKSRSLLLNQLAVLVHQAPGTAKPPGEGLTLEDGFLLARNWEVIRIVVVNVSEVQPPQSVGNRLDTASRFQSLVKDGLPNS